MKLIDSHAHYDDARFESEFEGGADAALKKSFDSGICAVINVATNSNNMISTLMLAEKYSNVFAAVGIHPTDCQSVNQSGQLLEVAKIAYAARHRKVVAIGEIGLDYHYDETDRERQIYFFEKQLTVAKNLNLPVIVHDRDAHGDALEIVKRHKEVRGVFHSFSASAEVARELVKLGWYISFGGPITYKNVNKLKEAAKAVPLDRLLVETDAPYLPPVPHRGDINYSAYMHYTIEGLANAVGVDVEALASHTVQNTIDLFGLDITQIQNSESVSDENSKSI